MSPAARPRTAAEPTPARRLPDFLFLGPSRSGSTWIYELLSSHPRIAMSRAKEIFFFDRFHDRGLEWYAGRFPAREAGVLSGEVCHDYLFRPEVPARVAEALPGVRLLCCLRHPLERAASSLAFFRRNGYPTADLEELLRRFPEIFVEGLYGRHLERWRRFFDQERVGILSFEELARDPDGFARRLFAHLGLEPSPRPLPPATNQATVPRWTTGARLAKRAAWLVRKALGPGWVGTLKRSGVLRRILFRPPEPEERETYEFPPQMVRSYLHDLRALEELTGFREPRWMLDLERRADELPEDGSWKAWADQWIASLPSRRRVL